MWVEVRKNESLLNQSEKITTAALVLQKASSRENSYNDAHHMNTVNAVKFKRTLYAKTVSNNRHSSYSGSQAPHSSSSLVCSKFTLKGRHANDCKVKCRFCRKSGHIKANCPKFRKKVNNIQGSGDGNGNYVFWRRCCCRWRWSVNVVQDEDQPFDYAFHVADVSRESSVMICNCLN